jgi:putative protease
MQANELALIGFGRYELDTTDVSIGAVVFKNDDPQLNRRLRSTFTGEDPLRRQALDLQVVAETGKPLRITGSLSSGISAQATGVELLSRATKRPIDLDVLKDKLSRLGGTPFELRELQATIVDEPMVPLGMLNQLRRDLVASLLVQLEQNPLRRIDLAAGRDLLQPIRELDGGEDDACEPRLAVLCRTLEQVEASCHSNVDLVYVDFHDIRRYADAVLMARKHSVPIGIASVRIQKPGEMGLLRVLRRHQPDFLLARNLAAIDYCHEGNVAAVADFSLNVANHRSAEWIRSLGVQRVTASYDLNREQILGLIDSIPPSWLEVVLHQHMPMFHMEHCVFCAILSPGTNKTNCGRPCDRHEVKLRDRVGAEHPLQADVACRNTLYNATPQSGAEIAAELLRRGIRWFRIELLTEDREHSRDTISLYRQLLQGQIAAQEVWRRLNASNRLGVTRGTLESKRNPLAIL